MNFLGCGPAALELIRLVPTSKLYNNVTNTSLCVALSSSLYSPSFYCDACD